MELPSKNKVIFIVLCFLLIIAVIFGALLGSITFKRESYLKYANYWCDTKWTCCSTSTPCDTTDNEKLDESGKLFKVAEEATYFPVDMIKTGSAYYQNCVLPVRNAMLNYAKSGSGNFNVEALFLGDNGATGPDWWGEGCTGPGGAIGTKCADPTYNPQVYPLCSYAPPDAFAGASSNFDTMEPKSYAAGPILPALTGNSYWNDNNRSINTNNGVWGSITGPVSSQLAGTGYSTSTNSSPWISTLQGSAGSNGNATNSKLYQNLLRPEKVQIHYPNCNSATDKCGQNPAPPI